jgi:hypothetical protein
MGASTPGRRPARWAALPCWYPSAPLGGGSINVQRLAANPRRPVGIRRLNFRQTNSPWITKQVVAGSGAIGLRQRPTRQRRAEEEGAAATTPS